MKAQDPEPHVSPGDSHLTVRISAAQNTLIRLAADATSKSVSEFVLNSATAAAKDVVADRRYFAVSDRTWRTFEAALDRPVVFKPRLHGLLNEDSPFQRR